MKAEKTWRPYESPGCPKCKSTEGEVLTKSNKDGWIYDGEEARCQKCHYPGYVAVEDSECADIIFDDEDQEG